MTGQSNGAGSGIEYREIECKSALNRVRGMPFGWSLNPYRGCVHECRYCFARATHRYFELGADEDFSRIIFVKANLPEVLAGELARRSWKRETVAIGTATDPYQPIEGQHRLTRRALELLAHSRTPVSIVTKGTMIVRDLDVLQEASERGGATVCFSVPTVDEETWRSSEPGTPPPRQRLRALERLNAAGVRAGVLMAPLLPGLSADAARIEETVRAAADAGARFIGANVLHLGPDVREYYLGYLEREHPELLEGYARLYGAGRRRGTKYAPEAYHERVRRRIAEAKEAAGYTVEEERWEPDRGPEEQQLMLPLLESLPGGAACAETPAGAGLWEAPRRIALTGRLAG